MFSILLLSLFIFTTDPAPAFSLVDMEGNMVTLSDFKGKVVYLTFWASWCKPCLNGFKNTQNIRQKLSKQGIVLINVTTDSSKEKWLLYPTKMRIAVLRCSAARTGEGA